MLSRSNVWNCEEARKALMMHSDDKNNIAAHLATKLLVFAVCLFGALKFDAHAETVLGVSLGQSEGGSMTEAKADMILSEANRILANGGSSGSACGGLALKRVGGVTKEKGITAFVNTASDLDKLLKNGTYSIIVVGGINYCGGTVTAGVVGCSMKGSSVIVEDVADDALAAILWMHEFGHTQNLSKATDGTPHTSRHNAVMREAIDVNTDNLTAAECGYLIKTAKMFPVISESSKRITVSSPTTSQPDPTDRVRALLSQLWSHGPPVSQVKQMGTDEINEIRRLLRSPEDYKLWTNAVTALGIVGVESDIDVLQAFVNASAPSKDISVARAKLQVPFSIGVLTSRFRSTSGLSFLRRHVNPNASQSIGLAATADRNQILSQQFAVQSLRGLALSGARATVDAALSDAKAANQAGAFSLGQSDELFEQLKEIQNDVDRMGIEAYIGR